MAIFAFATAESALQSSCHSAHPPEFRDVSEADASAVSHSIKRSDGICWPEKA